MGKKFLTGLVICSVLLAFTAAMPDRATAPCKNTPEIWTK